jgi:hypothetical protein
MLSMPKRLTTSAGHSAEKGVCRTQCKVGSMQDTVQRGEHTGHSAERGACRTQCREGSMQDTVQRGEHTGHNAERGAHRTQCSQTKREIKHPQLDITLLQAPRITD